MKKLKKWKTLYDTKATEILFEGEIITRYDYTMFWQPMLNVHLIGNFIYSDGNGI